MNCSIANNPAGTTNSSSAGNSTDDFWYPVPIKNASDYHEQLDQIIPSQYEVLLRQIMRKYKLTEISSMSENKTDTEPNQKSVPSSPCDNPNSILNNLLTNDGNLSQNLNSHINNLASQNVQFNWKNVWDYFYQAVETKIIKDIVNTTASVTSVSTSALANCTPVLTAEQMRAVATPASLQPFKNKIVNVTSAGHVHDFEDFLFSSMNSCNICNSTFKSSKAF